MAVTILHISDLHRTPGAEVTNDALLDSLERDRERHHREDPPIDNPDIIVVSGDLVHGVPQHAAGPAAHLSAQYNEAHSFLCA
jgi:3',5'-cyclic AMP phosphodiesterase CpdA